TAVLGHGAGAAGSFAARDAPLATRNDDGRRNFLLGAIADASRSLASGDARVQLLRWMAQRVAPARLAQPIFLGERLAIRFYRAGKSGCGWIDNRIRNNFHAD